MTLASQCASNCLNQIQKSVKEIINDPQATAREKFGLIRVLAAIAKGLMLVKYEKHPITIDRFIYLMKE